MAKKRRKMILQQSRLVSGIEASLNVLSGFFISWAVWVYLVAPLYGFDAGYVKALGITCIFTVSSLLRAFVIRRWFNNANKHGAEAVGRWLAAHFKEYIQ